MFTECLADLIHLVFPDGLREIDAFDFRSEGRVDGLIFERLGFEHERRRLRGRLSLRCSHCEGRADSLSIVGLKDCCSGERRFVGKDAGLSGPGKSLDSTLRRHRAARGMSGENRLSEIRWIHGSPPRFRSSCHRWLLKSHSDRRPNPFVLYQAHEAVYHTPSATRSPIWAIPLATSLPESLGS